MSSPIHHPKDLDAALMYAPPWARDQGEPVLPPAPTLPAPHPASAFSGDRAMMQLQRQLAFNPDKVPEPPTERARSLMPIALRLCAVGGAAAVVAWAMVSVPGTRETAGPTVPASFAPLAAPVRAKESTMVAAAQPKVPDQLVDAAEPPRQAAPGLVPPAPQPPQVEIKQADASPMQVPVQLPGQGLNQASVRASLAAPAPAVSATTAHFDSEEIAMLVKRAKDFLANGDFASARLLLRRATEAGNASAAMMLGGTFDPLVQRQSAIGGAVPDVAQARLWYKRAAELGSDTATQQLANLAKMGP
jgi:hypothetical protein